METNRPFSIITGGSSGIGRELAKIFIQEGYDVLIAADRDVDEACAQLGVDGVTANLATPEGVKALVERIEQIGRVPDAIVLNAGVGVGGPFLETSLDSEIEMIELNCTAVVRLAKLLLPAMSSRGSGRVLITSSIAATMPAPFEAVYGATKAFDLSLAEGLREELRETGVTVTALQPGPTDTAFFERAGLQDTKVGSGDKDDPAKVARQGFDAMMAGKDKVYAGSLKTRAEGIASELLPETVKAKQHAKQAKPGSGQPR
ncbi:MAG TPA: SDR family NAD(P)-dependent oxidoreductase [Kofleriaceae bacterium]|jgi:short-subunit dehydrogenase